MRPRPPDSLPSASPCRAAQECLAEEIWRLNRTRLRRGEACVDPILDRLHIDRFCQPDRAICFSRFGLGIG